MSLYECLHVESIRLAGRGSTFQVLLWESVNIWPWPSNLIPLGFCFHIYEMDIRSDALWNPPSAQTLCCSVKKRILNLNLRKTPVVLQRIVKLNSSTIPVPQTCNLALTELFLKFPCWGVAQLLWEMPETSAVAALELREPRVQN